MSPEVLLVLADSEVAAIARQGADLRVQLAAACLWDGKERRYASGWTLSLHQAQGPACAEFGALESGRLILAGQHLSRLPIAQVYDQPLRLELQFRRGSAWAAEALRLDLVPPHRATCHDDLSC